MIGRGAARAGGTDGAGSERAYDAGVTPSTVATRPAAPAVRSATKADHHWLADVFARAFWDDPVFTWLHPKQRTRYSAMRRFFAAELAAGRRHGRTVTTSDLAAVAHWAPPGRWRSTPWEQARMFPSGLLLAAKPKAGLTLVTAMEKAHPKEPHWYLATVGSDPNRRGTGAGAAVIDAVLQDCDRDGIPAYLESSKADNVPYYERFGFAVTGEISVLDSPPLFAMWRDPRAR